MKRYLILFLLCLMLAPAAQAQKMINHPWSGKRVGFIGDSITDPGSKASNTKWWNYLTEWLNLTPYTYAKSGKQWNDVDRQAQLLHDSVGDNIDAFLIMLGTNDFNSAVPVGDWFVETEEKTLAAVHGPKAMVMRKKRTPDYNPNTLRGRINIALRDLKRLYPTKQIVLLTPTHRAFANFSDHNIQPDEQYQNACGEYFDRYVESVKEAGNIWAVPVIDLNSLTGLYPLLDENAKAYFHDTAVDRLHPNDAGQARMARTIMMQLSALPCTF